MFGERYFATRERLSALMCGIAELAVETGADVSALLPLAELKTGLGTPFLLVVCGEVNAGKSTLINGLFGHALCRVSILPETDRVRCYRHGDPAQDLSVAPLLDGTLPPARIPAGFQPRRHPRHQLPHPGSPGNHRIFPNRRGSDPVRLSHLKSMGCGHLGCHFAHARRGAGSRGLHHPTSRSTRP